MKPLEAFKLINENPALATAVELIDDKGIGSEASRIAKRAILLALPPLADREYLLEDFLEAITRIEGNGYLLLSQAAIVAIDDSVKSGRPVHFEATSRRDGATLNYFSAHHFCHPSEREFVGYGWTVICPRMAQAE